MRTPDALDDADYRATVTQQLWQAAETERAAYLEWDTACASDCDATTVHRTHEAYVAAVAAHDDAIATYQALVTA